MFGISINKKKEEFALSRVKENFSFLKNNLKMYKLVTCLWLTLRKEIMSFLKVFWYYILSEIIVKICNVIMLLKMGSFLLFTEQWPQQMQQGLLSKL